MLVVFENKKNVASAQSIRYNLSMSHRLLQVNQNLQRELSLIIAESYAPSQGLLTVTHVLTTPDLRQATVWLSLLNHPHSEQVIESLNQRATEFFEPLSERLRMKHVPRLEFKLDDQPDQWGKIDAILDEINDDRKSSTNE